jgi:hypothetical protein
MATFDEFLELVAVYSEATGLSEATISGRLFNDGKRIEMLRTDQDRDVGIKKVEKAIEQLSESWPDGKAWPRGIKRPVKA